MIYIPNDGLDPAWNQAFEECAFELPTHDDLLLVWRNAPAVICGRYQNIFQEVHLPTAVAEGIHLVRRITGGGCVYHDPGNVNYALITDATQSGYDLPLCQMLEALRAIGIPAERSGSSALAIEGCKISGSAQRVSKGRLLHHGTLLFDANLQRLRRLANGHSACYTSKAIRSEPAPVGNIRDFLVDHTLDVETFCRRLIDALAPDETRPADFAAHATQLAEEKYRSWSWTFAPSPRFTFSRSCDFYGDAMQIAYEAEQGVLRNLRIECAGLDGARLCAALEGMRLEPEPIRHILEAQLSDFQRAAFLLDRLF